MGQVYIDGNHVFEPVIRDLYTSFRALKIGGAHAYHRAGTCARVSACRHDTAYAGVQFRVGGSCAYAYTYT